MSVAKSLADIEAAYSAFRNWTSVSVQPMDRHMLWSRRPRNVDVEVAGWDRWYGVIERVVLSALIPLSLHITALLAGQPSRSTQPCRFLCSPPQRCLHSQILPPDPLQTCPHPCRRPTATATSSPPLLPGHFQIAWMQTRRFREQIQHVCKTHHSRQSA